MDSSSPSTLRYLQVVAWFWSTEGQGNRRTTDWVPGWSYMLVLRAPIGSQPPSAFPHTSVQVRLGLIRLGYIRSGLTRLCYIRLSLISLG
jgi:hypothetical protein